MTNTLRILSLTCALLAPAVLADYDAHVYFGGSFLQGDASDFATDGYDFGFGGVSHGNGAMGLRWDLGFDLHDAREGAFPGRIVDDGRIDTTYFRLGPQWNFDGYDKSFYVNVMAGYYWTYAYIGQYATVPGIICDPFWGWCWTVPVSGQRILADRSEDDWGASATVGVEFETIGGAWFIELQYHIAEHGDGYEFAPLVIGMRW